MRWAPRKVVIKSNTIHGIRMMMNSKSLLISRVALIGPRAFKHLRNWLCHKVKWKVERIRKKVKIGVKKMRETTRRCPNPPMFPRRLKMKKK